MLRTATEAGNQIHLKPLDLTVDNLPTFGGTTMVPLDEYVQRNTADILTANKLIVGSGTNIIKDSLAEVDATGNINIPLDQGYFINSQPILFQDNADASKYKVEVHDGKFNNKITTNIINSIGTNDDITMDVNGTGKIKFNTLSNGGTVFSGEGPTNWAIEATNGNAVNSLVAGAYLQSGENRPTIGGNDSAPFSAWVPIWLQPVNVSSALVVIGDITQAVATASGAKLYVQGRISNDSAIRIHDNGGTNYHQLSASTTTGARLHVLQDSDGTIAHKSDIILANYSASSAGLDCSTLQDILFHSGKTLSKVDAFADIASGTTMIIDFKDAVTSLSLCILTCVGTGIPTYYSSSTIANLSGSETLISAEASRTAGAGLPLLYTCRMFV